MEKELEVLTDVYNEAGKCLKKDVSYLKVFDMDSIEIENYIDPKGKVISKYTGIVYRDKYYKINVPYETIKQYKLPLVITGLYAKSISNEKTKIKQTKSRVRRG